MVSVIIPVFNRAHLISETLNSLRNQTYTDWECIVVDDGSIDNIEETLNTYIASDSRFHFFKRPVGRSKGANACRNFGYEKSLGDIIIWLDSDDLFVPEHLQITMDLHKDWPDKDAIVNEAGIFFTVIGDSEQKWFNAFPVDSLLEELIKGSTAWPIGGVSWKRNSIPGLRPFNEKLKSSQEWTFHIQQILDGKSYLIIKDPTVFIRRHEERVGKTLSPDKFKNSFLARYIIWKQLYSRRELTVLKEKFLLRNMFQAAKKASENKYDELLLFFCWKFAVIFLRTKRKFSIVKITFLAIPLKRFFNRGERFFGI